MIVVKDLRTGELTHLTKSEFLTWLVKSFAGKVLKKLDKEALPDGYDIKVN
jgi:hypothetical protein